ncbi:zingipain-2-like [Dioscorea cayenensis subsp. rotundata]|uniref:Zingipain-2-like n=1 Tax=Dioscorea cayennensis subsp. rotundata TaxID=55577 RepID=A0AB40BZ36_DIOCR|nr:zingipain-2-like [Dioscorea cayenensis subsp. rotundata]
MASQLILFLSFLFLSFSTNIAYRSEHEIKLLYEGWLVENHKNYNDLFEKEKRYSIFKDNLKYIDEHNSGNHSYALGLTVFSDLTNDEYRSTYLGFLPPGINMGLKKSNRYLFNGHESLPDSIDWRKKGAVTPVKNQRQCNSCWAFTAIASIEGVNKIVTGKLISLSEQELLDCYQKNCDPGNTNEAFEFIIKNGGIDTEEDYPYKSHYVGCNLNKLKRKVVTIDDYEVVPQNSEDSLKKAVAHQPVSAAIDANSDAFQFYQKGVLTGNCGTDIDHGVTIVGYGSENGKDYWLIKNSYGPNWGDSGYVKIQRNSHQPEGKCGIAMYPSYPIKTKPKDNDNLLEEKAVEDTHADWPKTDAESKIAIE